MLVLVGEAFVLDDLADLGLAVVVVDLVGEVAGEHEGLVAERLDGVVQRWFGALAADEDAPRLRVAADVFAHRLARLELDELAAGVILDVGFPAAVEALEAGVDPGHAPFHEADTHVGVTVEQPVEHEAGEAHHLAEGVAEAVDGRVGSQVVHAQALVGAAVDSEAAAQPVGLGVDRPILLAAQMALEAHGGQHGAAEAQLLDDAAQLLHRLRRLLHGDQAEPLELAARLQVGVVEPVVVGLADLDGEVAVDHLAHRQTAGGIEHRAVDADVVHELEPARRAHLPEGAGHEFVKRSAVQVVQRREEPPLPPETVVVRRRHVLQQRFPVLHDVPVAVDDVHPIPGHVRPLSSLYALRRR